MHRQRILFVWLTLIVLAFPVAAYAADGGHLRLSVSDTNLAVGQEVSIAVLVEDAPTIYGADVRLTFDPALLEVVDADPSVNGIQLKPGDFIDSTKAFVLQHQADNTAGTVDYALTLLNPAPPVQGNGRLVEITFRAKAEGQTIISITEGLFGTQTGETIAPTLENLPVKITADGGGVLDSIPQVLGNSAPQNSILLGIIFLGLLLVIGAVGIGWVGVWLWRKRKPHG